MSKVRYKKSEELKRFEEFAFKKLKERYPNFPYPVKPKYKDNTTNELTACVIDAITLTGYQAERINTTGTQITTSSGTKWIKGSSTTGSADISATIKGKSVKIEIKCEATGDRYQSEAQKKYQKQIENAGGVYIVVRNFTEFYNWYGKFLKHK